MPLFHRLNSVWLDSMLACWRFGKGCLVLFDLRTRALNSEINLQHSRWHSNIACVLITDLVFEFQHCRWRALYSSCLFHHTTYDLLQMFPSIHPHNLLFIDKTSHSWLASLLLRCGLVPLPDPLHDSSSFKVLL